MRGNSRAGITGEPRPLVSGNHFFPSDPDEFKAIFLQASHSTLAGILHPAALMLPHGGLRYTRRSVSSLCSTLDLSEIEGFLLIAPVHREMSDVLWFPNYPGFTTPFGVLNLPEVAFREEITQLPLIRVANIPFDEEPAFDLILSLLASAVPDKPVLPLLAGSEDKRVISALSEIMTLMLPKNYLPVLSVNCSLPRPGSPAEFRCGEALFSLFAEHFRESKLQWYHGNMGEYSSSLWIDPHQERHKCKN